MRMVGDVAQTWLPLIHPQKLKLLQIQVSVCVTALLLAFLVVFGSLRRRCSSGLLSFLLWTAYVLSFLLISNTMGQMQSANFRNELFAVWAVFLLVVHGSADSISAYSLNDIEQRRRLYVENLAQLVWMGWLIVIYVRESKFRVPICLLTVLTIIKAGEKFTAYAQASRYGLFGTTKMIADFMSHEHKYSKAIDPKHMKGYKYWVRGEPSGRNPAHLKGLMSLLKGNVEKELKDKDDFRPSDKVVTIEKIWHWQCCEEEGSPQGGHPKGRLLTANGGDPDGRLKDLCLSFALFKLLRRRFAGYDLSECSEGGEDSSKAKEKTWKLVRDGLLSEDGDYERAFKVIEVELSFMYDFFYTKYSFLFESGLGKYLKASEIVIVGISAWMGVLILLDYQTPHDQLNIVTGRGHNVDVLVTGIAIVAIVVAEFIQLMFLIVSDWTKVLLICMYARRSSWHDSITEKIVKIVCSCRRPWLKPWERKIGQFSLFKSLGFRSSKFVQPIYTLTAFMFDRGVNAMKEKRIKLPAQVKTAVLHSLRNSKRGQRLSNGTASLSGNGFHCLLRACNAKFKTTEVIMVWHIATSLCEFRAPPPDDWATEKRNDFIVATNLSKYCAYLVVFAPRFLPDHAFVTECAFIKLIHEAKILLKECNSMESRWNKMMKLADEVPDEVPDEGSIEDPQPDEGSIEDPQPDEGSIEDPQLDEGLVEDPQPVNSVTKMGAWVGKKLMNDVRTQDKERLWKVLAEFWAELMLFVAPSDDATVHAEFLAKGGEFVTHLWALLSHAGLINQHSIVP